MIRLKATVPKPLLWRRDRFEREIKGVAKNLNNRIGRTYDAITETWENKPYFKKSIGASVLGKSVFTKGAIYASVTTDSDIYRYVTLGTEPHPIDPRPDNPTGLLIFQRNFKPKTKVGVLESSEGGKFGPFIFTDHVEHPGVEARDYESVIIKEQIPLIEKDLFEALKKQIRLDVETL